MKKIAIILLATLLPMMASALAFTVNGLSYEHLGGLNDGVRLLGFVGEKCPSEVIIPATVTNDGRTYSVEVISSGAFLGSKDLVSVEMKSQDKNGVRYIEPNSFAGCTSLSKVTFSGRLEGILAPGFSGQLGAFEGCTALESIDLPASMDYRGEVDATATHNICKWAFKNCTGLKRIIIRAKSPYIEDEAFINCSSLQYFVSYITQPWNLGSNTFQGIPSSATLIVPDGTKSSYQALSGWNAFTNVKEHSDVDLNAIIGGDNQPQGGGTAKLTIEDFTIKAGETQTVLIDMQNPNDQVTLVQFDLRLPEGLGLATDDDAIDIAGRTTWKKHTLTSNVTNGITRILLYSATNAVIEGTSGAIISIKLTANSSFKGGEITLENQLMTTPDLIESKPATYNYTIKGSEDPIVLNKEPYVVYNNSTLSFYYDDQRNNRHGELLDLIAYNRWSAYKATTTKVVFDASFAQVRPVTTYHWFYDFNKLKTIEGLENLNTSEVISMNMMFAQCLELTSLNLDNFDTGNVDDMYCMFYSCESLTGVNVKNFNTSNVTNMEGMFMYCKSLTTLDVSNFNTSKVTKMDEMFCGCSNLSSIVFGSAFVSSNSMELDMFYQCDQLKSVKFTGDIPSSINDYFFAGVGSSERPAKLEVPEQFRSNYAAMFDGKMFYGGYFTLDGDNSEYYTITMDGPARGFCAEYDLDFSGIQGIEAYVINDYSSTTRQLVLECVSDVPAATGLLLIGNPGTYQVPIVKSNSIYKNMLKGVLGETTRVMPEEGDYTNYLFYENKQQFVSIGHWGPYCDISPGYMYLQIPKNLSDEIGNTIQLSIDDITGIDHINKSCKPVDVYSLNGTMLMKDAESLKSLPKGVYIVNGQKIVVR